MMRTQLSAGYFSLLALYSMSMLASPSPGSVVAWGAENAIPKADLRRDLTNVVAIAAGSAHALALKYDGTVFGWGWNLYGQAIGTNPVSHQSANASGLVTIAGNVLSNIVGIAAGRTYSAALRREGTIVTWGEPPFKDNLGATNAVAISAGWSHLLVLRGDGTVVDSAGSVPPGLNDVKSISAGHSGFYARSLALKNDGTCVAWGPHSSLPMRTPHFLSNIVAIASGGGHFLALRNDGAVLGWGDNNVGQAVGNPNWSAPYYAEGIVTIQGEELRDGVSIAAAGQHSFAIRKNGAVLFWGGDKFHLMVPPQNVRNAISITVGTDYALGLITNDSVPLRQ